MTTRQIKTKKAKTMTTKTKPCRAWARARD